MNLCTSRDFQIADDLLDVESDTATLGKAAGKDASAGKATLVGLLGTEQARERLNELVRRAHDAFEPFGARAYVLRKAATFVADRRR